ncbi:MULTISPECIES: amidohydrolase [Pseudoalteromonas]|uniref:amidohydrolase n=1 Tax=Pseudoalteromonas TaxID=53246 RepID=UPI000FFEEE33|nr:MULTISPECIES: amidohydrolase [unclassified Pseudoalteromonas]MCG9758996.1 amidohydrolase [Pseudoalteromonas sp. Isolate6]RXE86046.1 amidohydrolase [Pseudoalteromonas sp. A757]
MNKRDTMITFTAIALSCVLAGCGENNTLTTQIEPSDPQFADKVFSNAAIYTVTQSKPWAQAMAVKDGEIVYLGDEKGAKSYIGKKTNVYDLAGKMVLPGLHDVHIHPLESASDATHFTAAQYDTIDGYQDVLYQAASENPDAAWLIGYGHNIDTLLDLDISPKVLIDEVIPDRPVIIMEQTSHSMWVNSKALSLANIHASSRDPIGGVIGRNDVGELNGILYDNAGNIAMDLAMQSLGDEQSQNYIGFVEYTQPMLLSHGITSISDARVYWQRGQLDTWQKLQADGVLKMRVSLGLWAYPEASDESQIRALKSFYNTTPNSLLKIDQIKFYMDGILVNTTAAMKEPYKVDWLKLDGNRGVNYFTQARLEKYIKALEPSGFDFNIHAIGDRGIHEALNAIEAASKGTARHRLTHVEVVDPEDYKRFSALGVIADAQVAGEFTQPHHWQEMQPLLGRERADHLVPIKSLSENGAMLTLSSDWNVSTLNPFIGIANAVTRQPEAISLEQAIAAYTINAAYAMRQEDIVGSLEVGKLADFIVLDRNLFDVTFEEIKATKVTQTWVHGNQAF